MSPKIEVHPLRFLCVKFLSNEVIQLLSDDDRICVEPLRDYLTDVTYDVLQEILKDILNSSDLDAATRFSSLKVLLRNDVRKLETGIFPHPYYEKILRTIISNGKGLRQLNLKGVWARDHPTLLSELVSSLDNLKVLIIPHMANDAVLECIARCENLNTLDISGEASFTIDGLKRLKNENLQILDIGYCGKKEVCENGGNDHTELISVTINNLPNLKSVRTYCFTGEALSHLNRRKVHLPTKLTYLHDTGTTNETFDAIIELCPYLESLHMESPEGGVILRLTALKRLTCLKLTKPSNDELIEYLSKFQSNNIEILKVNNNRSQPLDLSLVALGSPKLQTMEFYHMNLTFTKSETFFLYLQNIEIIYCDISDDDLRLLLSNSPSLRRVIVGCMINFTDGDVFRLCAECDFDFLEELWFSSARSLTLMSAELLMGHCPNLRMLGQMDGWDVTQEELEFFISLIQVSNIDLILRPSVIRV